MQSLMGVPTTLLLGLQSIYLAEFQERWNTAYSFQLPCSKQRLSASDAESLMLQVQLHPFS